MAELRIRMPGTELEASGNERFLETVLMKICDKDVKPNPQKAGTEEVLMELEPPEPDIKHEVVVIYDNAGIPSITDAISLIRRYSKKEALIYCDPPYLQTLRKKCMYAHEMSEEKHVEMLEALLESEAKVIVSGYDSTLYNEMLKGWRTDEAVTTVQLGLHRTEKLWMNF